MLGFIIFFFSIGLTLWAQINVQSNFRRWSQVPARAGLSGAEVARKILDERNLSHVPVEKIPGTLSDHYDPTKPAVRLSEAVYHSDSLSAISVASHECGHVLQHHENYGFLTLRHRLVPVFRITSGMAPWFLMAGLFFQATQLFWLGILFFSVVVLFHLITLPVELNASQRAQNILIQSHLIDLEEKRGVQKMLRAAALTYVAGALVALMELVRLLLIFLSQQGEE